MSSSPSVGVIQPSSSPGADPGIPMPTLSIIVPTYKEVENLPHLIERIEQVRDAHGLTLELLIVDDDSKDGTAELLAALNKDWIRLLVRKANRGLSLAVMDGLRAAKNEILLVMDADLSHPPEKIPELLRTLDSGCDFVVGSRYVPGGTTDGEWGLFRWLNSKVATLLARPLTTLKDPMAGFFALRRATFEQGQKALNPIGYKIGLELLVKCNCKNAREVPIHFAERTLGESKLSFQEQLKYLQHLRRLFIFRYWSWSHLLQFLIVGCSGVIVNLAVLTLLLALKTPETGAVAGGIVVSLVTNFFLNRRITFSYARHGSLPRQFLGFTAACSVGMLVNYAVTLLVRPSVGSVQLAALLGIVAGMGFNYLSTRYLIFHFKSANPEFYRAAPERYS